MRKNLRLFLCALFVLAFFLLAPSLLERPKATDQPAEDKPISAAIISISGSVDRQAGSQSAPLRVDRPEGAAFTNSQAVFEPDVKADANGHPLGESTYVRAVYQAFRLEEKSG